MSASPIPGAGHRLRDALTRVRAAPTVESRGRVVQLIGLVVESEGPMAAVGEVIAGRLRGFAEAAAAGAI